MKLSNFLFFFIYYFDELTLLTICEGEDVTELSNGDVLIFPDMIKYTLLTRYGVCSFVRDVLVKESVWSGGFEILKGSYIFVCAHDSRDWRCGSTGPLVVKKFKDEIESRRLHLEVSVSPCTDIGGHENANVIIYSQNSNKEVTGHWYGYVTPDDVPKLFKRHIEKGEILEHLWRGQMGLLLEEQREARELRLRQKAKNEGRIPRRGSVQVTDSTANETPSAAASTSCQSSGNLIGGCVDEQKTESTSSSSSKKKGKKGNRSSALKMGWEHVDTYTALALVVALGTIAVAYSFYNRRSR